MYDNLVKSISALQRSKYGYGNKKRLTSIQLALKQAKPLFEELNIQPDDNPKPIPILSFRNVDQKDQIPKIIDEFILDFQNESLKKDSSAKSYSLFGITLLKIIRTLDEDKNRGLLSAHAINRIQKMFMTYPVFYGKKQTRDPLGLVFSIIELVLDTERNLNKKYEFDPIIVQQIIPFMQKCYLRYSNPLGDLMADFEKMPKFRINTVIDDSYRNILLEFFKDSILSIPVNEKIKKTGELLDWIHSEGVDHVSLQYYDVLKISFKDKDVVQHLASKAKSLSKTNKRFTNTILEEISNL